MIRSVFAFMLMAAFSCVATARADETERLIFVPAGTPVKVHLVGTLSSKDARDDQTFPIAAAEDVVIDGMVVIPKGAGGEGVVKKVDGARGSGHSGSLQLVMNYVHSADGGKIALTTSVQNQSEEDRKGASSTATIIGVATFGLGGLFAHNLARGREEVLDDKKIMNVFTDSNVHVQTSMKPQQPDSSYDK
jgi:hypothetical protein